MARLGVMPLNMDSSARYPGIPHTFCFLTGTFPWDFGTDTGYFLIFLNYSNYLLERGLGCLLLC